MSASDKRQWLPAVILFGVVYLLVGVAFPNPPATDKLQFVWRLVAWLICAVAYGLHIGFEHFGLRHSPRRTALHVAAAVALGAFGLAAAANIHALMAGTGNRRLLALALLIWPMITAVPAFVVAWAGSAGLGLVRPNQKENI